MCLLYTQWFLLRIPLCHPGGKILAMLPKKHVVHLLWSILGLLGQELLARAAMARVMRFAQPDLNRLD